MSSIYDPAYIRSNSKKNYSYVCNAQVRNIEIVGAIPDKWISVILDSLEKRPIPFFDGNGDLIRKRYSPFRMELIFIPNRKNEKRPRVLVYVETEDGNLIHFWFMFSSESDRPTRYQVLEVLGRTEQLFD